jgi:hypothetical protein
MDGRELEAVILNEMCVRQRKSVSGLDATIGPANALKSVWVDRSWRRKMHGDAEDFANDWTLEISQDSNSSKAT